MKAFKNILLYILAIAIGMIISYGIMKDRQDKDVINNNLSIIENYFSTEEEINKEDLKIKALKSVVENLGDPYSVVLDKDELDSFLEVVEGEFLGFGFALNKKVEGDEGVKVGRVYKNTTIYDQGLMARDEVIKINDKEVKDLDADSITNIFETSQHINITVYRPATKEIKEYSVNKEKMKMEAVDYKILDGDIAYIAIISFNSNILDEFENALYDMQDKGIKKLILDLRDNAGGDLQLASKLESFFVPYDIKDIFKYKNLRNARELKFQNTRKNIFSGETIILVNSHTASASEVFADSMRELDLAKLIGTKTYGKGSMQSVILDKNNDIGLKITTANYTRKDASRIDGIGISPDIVVEQDDLISDIAYINEPKERRSIRLKNIESLLARKYGEKKAKSIVENGDLQLKMAVEELSK